MTVMATAGGIKSRYQNSKDPEGNQICMLFYTKQTG